MTTVASLRVRGSATTQLGRNAKGKMAFFGNPFSSQVGQKIEQATDASLTSEDWALNMEICDIINRTEDGPKDAIKAIRKRLNQNASNFTVVMYTLVVLETCVKNCGKKFHVLACNKEFISELVKFVNPKKEIGLKKEACSASDVQDKVLNLIQSWADAFRNEPELLGVVQVYNELKQRRIEFPMTDLDSMAPIHTPQRSLPDEIGGGGGGGGGGGDSTNVSSSTALTSEQLGKLFSELRVVEGNMTVFSEMLSELVPGKESPDELELLKELHSTCQAMQERLVELINVLSNDEITAELLRVNDGLNNLFLRHSRYEKNRASSARETSKGEEVSLIDHTDSTPAIANLLGDLSLNATSTELNPISFDKSRNDEFDMLAHSRNVTSKSSILGGNSFEAPKEASKLTPTLATPSTQPKGQLNMHSERDFDEMAAWLGEKDEESITSTEFDKFLAERAAAAEALPSAADSNASRGRTKKEEDSMFAL